MTTNELLHYHKMMKRTQHILISGHVQGVGYRAFVKNCAEQMGLGGWVRNLTDGRVEAVLQSTEEEWRKLEKVLLEGPRLSSVTGIELQLVQSQLELVTFEITEDGVEPWLKRQQKK